MLHDILYAGFSHQGVLYDVIYADFSPGECYMMWDVSQYVVYAGFSREGVLLDMVCAGFSPEVVLQDAGCASGCGICRY